MLAELLRAQLPAVGYQPPQAGYLAWLDCRALGLGDDPAEVFLEGGEWHSAPGRASAPLASAGLDSTSGPPPICWRRPSGGWPALSARPADHSLGRARQVPAGSQPAVARAKASMPASASCSRGTELA